MLAANMNLISYFTDTAKRRLLPAWIREGLEKMEREKQRAAEREKLAKEKLEEERKESADPRKSRFVS